MDIMNPRLQIVTGGLIWVSAIYCAQFPMSFTAFMIVYSVIGGIGFGIVYFVPLLCAWSYFPTKRNLVAGFVLCAFSLNAIVTSAVTQQIVNPLNDDPSITIELGKNTESFFPVNSYQVEQLPRMWTRLSQIALLCFILSLPLLTKKPDDVTQRKSATQVLDDAIRETEEKEGFQSDEECEGPPNL